MGIQAKVFSKNKLARSKSVGVRKQRKALRKGQKDKSVVVENIELLSKDQLKKLAKNPKNSIRPSGKRKRKMLKRLRHQEKEKNMMDCETQAGPSKSGDKTGSEEMGTAVDDSDVEMAEG